MVSWVENKVSHSESEVRWPVVNEENVTLVWMARWHFLNGSLPANLSPYRFVTISTTGAGAAAWGVAALTGSFLVSRLMVAV